MSLFGFDSCPSCKTSRIKRSHRRNVFEHILGVVALPYRCEMCDVRFFVPRLVARTEAAKEKAKAAGV